MAILLGSAVAAVSALRSGQRSLRQGQKTLDEAQKGIRDEMVEQIGGLRDSMAALAQALSKLAQDYAVHEESNRAIDRVVIELGARMGQLERWREDTRVAIHDIRNEVQYLKLAEATQHRNPRRGEPGHKEG